jgi:hypothetical protein
MVLDDILPEYDVAERHTIRIAARPGETLAAARAITVKEVPVFVALMALRTLPALLFRRRSLGLGGSILGGFRRMGFAVAADTEDEIVIVGVGRFWRPDGGLRRIAPEDFAAFDEPGFAKVGFNFSVDPSGVLATETRVQATDRAARRSFGRYWLLVRPGSGAIRRDWLRAIRRRAEYARHGA